MAESKLVIKNNLFYINYVDTPLKMFFEVRGNKIPYNKLPDNNDS